MKAKKKTTQITFAEANQKSPFNWFAFLNKKKFTIAQLEKAEERAKNWVTCGCGNQCAIIPRNEAQGEPIDKELVCLGVEFYRAVRDMFNQQKDIEFSNTFNVDYDFKGGWEYFENRKATALKTLNDIEVISSKLIAEEIELLNVKASYVGLKLVKA